MGAVVASYIPGNPYIRRDIDEQQFEIEDIKEEMEEIDKLARNLDQLKKDAQEQENLIRTQKKELNQQESELDGLREECANLKAVEGERRGLQKARYELEKGKKRAKREDEILDLPFTCIQCKLTLKLRQVRHFCDCDDSDRQNRDKDPFQGLLPAFERAFRKLDVEGASVLDGVGFCRLKACMDLFTAPVGDRPALRLAAQTAQYGAQQQAAALRHYGIPGKQGTLDQFWEFFYNKRTRPSLPMIQYLLQELTIISPLGELFPHIPFEKDIRTMLKI